MPISTCPLSDLTPVQRRQQLAEILARGVLRLLRQRPTPWHTPPPPKKPPFPRHNPLKPAA